MLSVRLDEETERQLADILAHEQTDKSELIRRLITERWLTLQAGKTLVERRGGHPEHLLQDAPMDLSERSNRKKAIAQYLNNRHPWPTIRLYSWIADFCLCTIAPEISITNRCVTSLRTVLLGW